MDPEFQDIEDTLKGLRPAATDAACLGRLLAAVEGRLQTGDLSMAGVESRLAAMHPVAPAPEVFERMLETVSRVPFPVNDKVVLFPGSSAKPAPAKSVSRRPWYAAAAAVAVAGAFTAMMVGGPGANHPGLVDKSKTVEGPLPLPNKGNIISASAGTNLQDAADQGVRWMKDGKPMRVVRVQYMDRVKFTNKEGKVIEMEVPREEYLMVPEKID